MNQSPWWERLPDRFLREHAALERCAQIPEGYIESFAWRVDGDTLVLSVKLRAWALEGIEVRFPNNYPDGCPDVRPSPFVSLSTHQYVKTGALCLELGPDNWHSELLAVDLVVSAGRLELGELVRIVRGVPLPSRHAEPAWHREGAISGRALILTSGSFRVASAVNAPTLAPLAQFLCAARIQYWLSTVALDASSASLPRAVADGISKQVDGCILPDTILSSAVPRNRDELRVWLTERGVGLGEHLIVFLPNATPSTAVRISPESVDELYVIEVPDVDLRATESLQAARGCRVGIVGLGSIGSKVAVALARAGVRQFTLVDGDLMLADNLVRHAGDLRHLGMLKSDVAEDLIRAVVFDDVEVAKWPFEIGGALPPELHSRMLDSLAECDVLIDATANPRAHAILAAVASDHARPIVWSEVWAGGIGGLLACAVPSNTPCPRCVRRAYLSECALLPPAPFRDSENRYATGDEAPVTAMDADVGMLASATAQTALRLMAGRVDSVEPITFFGFERIWIFSRPYETRSVRCWRDDWNCARCWKPATAPDAVATAGMKKILGSPLGWVGRRTARS